MSAFRNELTLSERLANVRFDADNGHKVGRWWGRVSWRGAIARFDGGATDRMADSASTLLRLLNS